MPQMAISQMSPRMRTLTDMPRNSVNKALYGAKGLAAGAQLARGAPGTIRVAWRLGKRVGWAQGAAAVAPYAARGWWSGLTGRMEARVSRWRAGSIARWVPLSVTGVQLGLRGWSLLRRATPSRARARSQSVRSSALRNVALPGAFRAGALRGQAGGLAARASAQASAQAERARAARATTRARWAVWRTGQMAAIQTAGQAAGQTATRKLRAGLRFTRLFITGFAVGMFWAYLFAPRTGPGYQAVREGGQRARSA